MNNNNNLSHEELDTTNKELDENTSQDDLLKSDEVKIAQETFSAIPVGVTPPGIPTNGVSQNIPPPPSMPPNVNSNKLKEVLSDKEITEAIKIANDQVDSDNTAPKKEIAEAMEEVEKARIILQDKKQKLKELASKVPQKRYDYIINTKLLNELYVNGTPLRGYNDLYRRVISLKDIDSSKITKVNDLTSLSESIRNRCKTKVETYCEITPDKKNQRILYITKLKNIKGRLDKEDDLKQISDVEDTILDNFDKLITVEEKMKKLNELRKDNINDKK